VGAKKLPRLVPKIVTLNHTFFVTEKYLKLEFAAGLVHFLTKKYFAEPDYLYVVKIYCIFYFIIFFCENKFTFLEFSRKLA